MRHTTLLMSVVAGRANATAGFFCHRSAPLLAATVSTSRRWHGDEKTGDRTKPLDVTWRLPKQHWATIGKEKKTVGYDGQTLMEVAHEHDLPMEAACGGVSACSTCHCMLEDAAMDLFPPATETEDDMIDQAFYPTTTSRLACQLKLSQAKHNGLVVKLPSATRNMAVDGHVAKPH